MLQEALAVVEAARRLSPAPVGSIPGHWRLQCEPRKLAEAIRDLGESLQTFDASTGNAKDPVALLVRAIRYAETRGVPAAEMVASIRSPGGPDDIQAVEVAPRPASRAKSTETSDGDDQGRVAESLTELRPQPGEIGKPDSVTDGSPVQAPRPEIRPGRGNRADVADKYKTESEMGTAPKLPNPAIVALAAVARPLPGGETAMGTRLPALDNGLSYDPDNALADAGDYQADGGVEMDAIGDRLEYAVSRFGWTPKLKMLAAAFRNARNKMMGASDDIDPKMQVSMQDAMVIAKVSRELSLIVASPDPNLVEEEQYDWIPPTPFRP